MLWCVRETLTGCLSHAPNWGPGRQPRRVPWQEIEPATFQFVGWYSIHWATPARVTCSFSEPYNIVSSLWINLLFYVLHANISFSKFPDHTGDQKCPRTAFERQRYAEGKCARTETEHEHFWVPVPCVLAERLQASPNVQRSNVLIYKRGLK